MHKHSRLWNVVVAAMLLLPALANAEQITLFGSGAGGGSVTPGGSSGQVQYNNAGAFGGITGATTDGTALTLVAPVLGTPASGVATNLTGTAAGLTAGHVTTNANLTGDVTSVGNATTLAMAQPGAHTWALAQTINLNAASAMTALSGQALQVSAADSVIGRVGIDSFGAISAFTARRADGTAASPTKILSGEQIGGFNAYSYVQLASPGYVGPIGSMQIFATQDQTTSANGSKIILATTPNNSTTLTTAVTIDQDQSVTLVGRATVVGETNTANGAVSLPAALYSGTILTGGTGTTNFPNMFIQPTGTTASSTLSTSGTAFGINVGAVGNFVDFMLAGVSKFSINGTNGGITTAGSISVNTGNITIGSGQLYQWSGRGILTSSGAGTVNFGAGDAAAPVAQTTRVQSVVAGTAAANGANWTLIGSLPTGTGTSGDIIFQTGIKTGSGTTQGVATTALTIKGETQQVTFAGQINVAAMTQTATAQSGTVCYNSGTGAITYDATVGCLTSTLTEKDDWQNITPEQALAVVMKMQAGSYTYKTGRGLPAGPQIGLAAEQLEEIDDRLVGHRPDGSLQGVRYQQASSLYPMAIQALQKEIVMLKARLN